MAFIPVLSSILMVYTLALANSYGRLISELKRQIETVSRAGSLGRGSGEYGKEHGGDKVCLTSASLYPLLQEAQNKVFLAQRAVALSSANGAL